MDGRTRKVCGRATMAVAVGGMAVAMGGGCSPLETADVLSTVEGTGGRLVASTTQGTAGQTITLDASGSSPNEDDNCAGGVRIFIDGVAGAIASRQRRGASSIEPGELETFRDGAVCRVVNGEFQVKLPAGAPGSTVTRTYSAQTASADYFGNEKTKAQVKTSVATVAIKVTTPPAAGSTPVTQPATPPAPGGGTTPPPGGGGGGGTPLPAGLTYPQPAKATCALPASGTGNPELRAAFDLHQPVAGNGVYLSARASDPDGIARYDYDTDNDGTPDDSHVIGPGDDGTESGAYITTPSAGPLAACVKVTDNLGNSAVMGFESTVLPAGSFMASYWMPPHSPAPEAGETASFTIIDPPDDTTIDIDYGDGTSAGSHSGDGPGNISFDHVYASAGVYKATLVQQRGDAVSTRSSLVAVVPATPGRAVAAAKAKPVVLPSALKVTGGKIVSQGKVKIADGLTITTKGAIVRATTAGSLPKAVRRQGALRGLGFLVNSRMVARIDGTLVPLGPDSYGVAGKATVLAQSRKDKRTMGCMTLTTDGISTPGSVWRLAGATGKAKGLKAGGTVAPLAIGTPPATPPTGVTAVTPGRSKGIGRCKGLVKLLKGRK